MMINKIASVHASLQLSRYLYVPSAVYFEWLYQKSTVQA